MNFLTCYVVIDADDKRLNARLLRVEKATERSAERAEKAVGRAAERASKRKEQTADRAVRMSERTAERSTKIQERAAERQVKLTERATERAMKAAEKASRRTTQRITKYFKNMGKSIKRVFSRMGQTVKRWARRIALAILAIGAACVKMAMDAEESENLFEVSMGKMATAARKWSEQLQKDLYLNAYEVRKNVGTFNVMFKSMGMTTQAAYDMATSLTMLSYDMASFYNLKPAEAFAKIRSGIVGQSRPLKDLGILINDTAVKQYAMNNAIGGTTGALTELEKVQIREKLLLQQTIKAQGDLARTLDSTTNVFRSLWALIKATAIGIGQKLQPAVTKTARAMRDWLKENKEQVIEWAGVWIKRIEKVIDKIWELVKILTTDFSRGMDILKEELITVLSAVVDSFLIAGIAAGKAFMKGVLGFDGISSSRMWEEWEKENKGKKRPGLLGLGAMPEEDWQRISTKLMIEDLKKEVNIVEQLKTAWENVGSAIPDPAKADYQIIEVEGGRSWDDVITSMADNTNKASEAVSKLGLRWKEVGAEVSNWVKDAGQWGRKLGQILVDGFNSAADALAELCMGGKVNFKAMAQSIIKALIAMIIKLQIAKALMAIFPGLAPAPIPVTIVPAPPVPGLQHGGEVTQTGLAKVHKGEKFSGVNGEMGFGGVTINNYVSDTVDIEVADDGRTIDLIKRASIQMAATDGEYRDAHSRIRR